MIETEIPIDPLEAINNNVEDSIEEIPRDDDDNVQKENEKKKNLTKRRIFSTTPRIDHGHDDRDEQRSVFVTVLSLWGVLLRVKNDDLSVIKRGDGRECDISARGSRKPTPP